MPFKIIVRTYLDDFTEILAGLLDEALDRHLERGLGNENVPEQTRGILNVNMEHI